MPLQKRVNKAHIVLQNISFTKLKIRLKIIDLLNCDFTMNKKNGLDLFNGSARYFLAVFVS